MPKKHPPNEACTRCDHVWAAHRPNVSGTHRCDATVHFSNAGETAYSFPCPCPGFRP